MPEDPNIIFKLSLDSSGFIVNKPVADLQKFIDAQRVANQTLLESQARLKTTADRVADLTAQLEKAKANNASNVPFLTTELASAQGALDNITSKVKQNQAELDKANTSAQDYLTTLQKAAALPAIPAPGNTLQPAQLDLFNPPPAPVLPAAGGQLDLNFPTQLPEEISNTTAEMEKLAAALELVKDRMDELDPKSEEWQQLNEVLVAGNAVLAEHTKQLQDNGSAINEATQKHTTYITRIRVLREELLRLSEAGKENTQEFRTTSIEAAKLSREYRLLQERIRVLSSENRAVDFGKAAIRGAIGAFETFTSLSVLTGEKNEELEKKTLKLFAAMQLLNGVEELTNLARKSSTVVIELQSAATAVYTAVVGAATGATKALRIALLSTGIGAIVVGLGLLIKHFIDLKEAQEAANEEAKVTNEINEKAIDGYASQVANLDILKRQLTDLSVSESKRVELAKEYNKTADEANKIDLQRINQTDLVTAAINRQADAIKARATAQAGITVADEKANTVFKEQQKIIEKFPDLEKVLTVSPDKLNKILNQAKDASVSIIGKAGDEIEEAATIAKLKQSGKFKELEELTTSQVHEIIQAIISGDVKVFQTAVGELDKASKLAANLQLKLPQAPEEDPNTVKARRAQLTAAIAENERLFAESKGKSEGFRNNLIAENKIFQKELDDLTLKEAKLPGAVQNTFLTQQAELTRQLADVQRSTLVSVETITKDFDERLNQEKIKLAEEVKKKQITQKESKVLLELFVEVNEAQKTKAIDELIKSQVDAQQQIQDQIVSLRQKAETDTINNIQEEFTRRAAIIETSERIELTNRQRAEDAQIRSLQQKRDAGLLTEQQFQDDKNAIIEAGETEATSITVKFAQQRQDLSLAIFKNTLDAIRAATVDANDKINASTAVFVKNAADRFFTGKISFDKFKKETDTFIQSQARTQRENTIKGNNEEILRNKLKLDTIRDRTSKTYTDLFERNRVLQEQTTKLEQDNDVANVEQKQKKTQERIDAIQGYADAIGNITTSVIGFWQAANEAEAQALDRSIALQQRRVDEAIRIADKGNAQYLKQEQDRLKELEVQRENSARRQLGVNAALQASQILVAITGAIAKIATSPVGTAEVFADIGIIIGALATGYGLIKQLQANQPRFKEGTPYVSRGANKAGTDTIPAWLNEGEAVIPTERNRKYKGAVDAIYHERIPADVLNEFVSKYSRTRSEKTVVEKVFKSKPVSTEFINNVSKNNFDEKSKMIYTLQNLTKRFMGMEHDTPFLSSLKSHEIQTYSEVIAKTINENRGLAVNDIVFKVLNPAPKSENVSKYEKFVSGINNVSQKKISEFIYEYEKATVEKQVREKAIAQIAPVAIRAKEIASNKLIERKLADHSSFIRSFEIKHVPVPNYEHIQTVNEMKLGQDGKLREVMQEQNSLLKENNEHHKETQRLLKSMGVNVKIDQEGVSAMVMKAIEQKKIYSKI